MGITEELKSLEEMNTKGTLTNEEFAAAKAAAISKYGQSASTQPASKAPEAPEKKSTAGRVLLFVFILVVLGVWYAAQHNVSGTTTSAALKAAARMPVDLTNEVENLPASSWRAVPIQLPYDGSLTISVQVVRGNPIEMFLTDSNNVEKLRSGETRASPYGGFYAVKATTFQHTERLSRGTYHVVLRDNTLGFLSYSASDVSLKARIEP